MNAPVAIFAYNRPTHLSQLLDSLTKCDGFADSPLFAFVDGPRTPTDVPLVNETRRVLRNKLGANVEIRDNQRNLGLARQIITGVSYLFETHQNVIVVEDDLVLRADFLTFMNDALTFYEDATHVLQVSGHMFDVPAFSKRSEALLFPLTTTWGWGTWREVWVRFTADRSLDESLQKDRQLRGRFNLDGAYDYTTMLESQKRGHLNSWGISWYWYCFRNNGLTCFPPQSLVCNTGFDGSGTHGGRLMRLRGSEQQCSKLERRLRFRPASSIAVDQEAWRDVKNAIYHANGAQLGQIRDAMKRILLRMRQPLPLQF